MQDAERGAEDERYDPDHLAIEDAQQQIEVGFDALEARLEDITDPLDVAVIGCVVNGPDEAREAHIGLASGTPHNLLYHDGKPDYKVDNDKLVDELEKVIRGKIRLRKESGVDISRMIPIKPVANER